MRATQRRQVCILLPDKQHLHCTVRIPFVLFLRVQHYVESGRTDIVSWSSKIQQLYYAELRQKVLRSQSRHQEALFFQLAACALQAEVGDLGLNDEERQETTHRHYFLPEDYFPSWEKKELRSLILLGVELKGVHIYQGCRFEISAVGSLCLSKLVYYTPSALHSKHILRHLTDSHRLHINTRDAVSCIQQLEDMEACQFYKEAYICDTTRLTHRLQSLTSSMSDCSDAVEMTTAWPEEEEDDEEVTEFELCVDEPQEFFVDDPAEVLWLAELLHAASVGGPLASSHWA
ncbi:FERM domain-containing protein 1, partial [Nibea albiflora]